MLLGQPPAVVDEISLRDAEGILERYQAMMGTGKEHGRGS